MSQVELHKHVFVAFASGARAAGVSQVSAEYNVDDFSTISYIVDLTAVSGTPDSYSLVTKIQYSPDTTGSRWYDLPNTSLTVSSVTTNNIVNVPLLTARRVRAVYTLSFVGGTSPQATFSIDVAYGNTPPSSTITNTGTAVSSVDGADVTQGSTSDAAASAGGTGTVSAKLRKISADLATLLTQTDGLEASLTSIDGKTPASPATSGKQDTGNTSLAAIDTNAGVTTDAAVTTDANGTLSAKLRGLVKIFNDVWDSTTHFLKVKELYQPAYEINTGTGYARTRQPCSFSNITADTAVLSGSGFFYGFICNSTTAGTVKFYDNTAASGTVILNTFTPAAAGIYIFPAVMVGTGIYADITSTLDITVLYAAA